MLASTANERTHLAWNRTALSWAGAGAIVARFHAPGGLLDGQTVAGFVMIGCAVVVYLVGWWRYRVRDAALRHGRVLPEAPTMVGVTSAVMTVTALVAFVLEIDALT